MTRPVIGLSVDHEVTPPRAILRDAYYDAVYAAGGIPMLLPPIDDAGFLGEVLPRIDALILGGGDDLHPTLWGEESLHPSCTLVTARRQACDVKLARMAWDLKMPMLGICCGMQTVNVVQGGSILQDISTARPSALIHKAKESEPPIEHDVTVERRSRLFGILGGSLRLRTNSMHHQACDRLGEGLSVVARAQDGLIEAFEGGCGWFCLCVQWHPEKLVDRVEHLAIFEGLVEAAGCKSDRE
ncbi:gamma-glutamyl-gamma-aminobutyrate hydrolase family protein [Planctomycetota bacterium]